MCIILPADCTNQSASTESWPGFETVEAAKDIVSDVENAVLVVQVHIPPFSVAGIDLAPLEQIILIIVSTHTEIASWRMRNSVDPRLPELVQGMPQRWARSANAAKL